MKLYLLIKFYYCNIFMLKHSKIKKSLLFYIHWPHFYSPVLLPRFTHHQSQEKANNSTDFILQIQYKATAIKYKHYKEEIINKNEYSFGSAAISVNSFWTAPNLTHKVTVVFSVQIHPPHVTYWLNLALTVSIRTFSFWKYTFRKNVKYCGKHVGPVLNTTAERKVPPISVKLLRKAWDKKRIEHLVHTCVRYSGI